MTSATPALNEQNVPRQDGRVFVVVGGDVGAGFELCKILYRTGATTYMTSPSEQARKGPWRRRCRGEPGEIGPMLKAGAARKQDRATSAIRRITKESVSVEKPGEIKFLQLNLGSLNSVGKAAKRFVEQETQLDVLWNSTSARADIEARDNKTEDGLEAMVGVHCVATMHLTSLLVPQLGVSAAVSDGSGRTRVVWHASNAVDRAPDNGLDLASLKDGARDAARNLAISQAGVCMLAKEMLQWFNNWGVVSVVQSPDAGSSSPSEKQAAYTALFAGLSSDITLEDNGAFILPGGKIVADEDVLREDIVKALRPTEVGGLGYSKKLWDWCREQCEPFKVVNP
ncbi:NAD(P)-binding protein [Paramyrothecium foliicola]|nr:NAD(P)-binding protein [Paramyrothecium foliicola]